MIPVEVAAQTKIDSTTGVEQEQEEEQGEMAWYEVFVGENSVPTISLLSPGSKDVWVLGSHTWLGWEIVDSDGDALTLELLYDFDDRISGAISIAQGIGESGRLQWEPPASLLTETAADLNSDGQLNWQDLMLLAENWQQSDQTGTKVKIFARVRDSKGAMKEAVSEGWVIFPDSCPANFEGLQAWMKQLKME